MNKKLDKVEKTEEPIEDTEKEEKFDIDQVLLKSREVFLTGVICESTSNEIIKQLMALDKVNHDPIIMWINSPGGSVQDGFSIIDTMDGIGSPVVTIICGKACSMAGLISVAGQSRYITRNSLFMAHDMSSGVADYASKAIARVGFWKKMQVRLREFLKKNTKLTNTDLDIAKNNELWLYADECKVKGIVDYIVGEKPPKKKSNKKNSPKPVKKLLKRTKRVVKKTKRK